MYFFPNCCLFFVYDSVSIGQNLLNEKPVENSLLVDFAYYHFNSFNGNLNGYQSPGRIICIGPCGPKTTKADDKLEALVQWGRPPPLVSGPWLPPPPYLKVCIRRCSAPPDSLCWKSNWIRLLFIYLFIYLLIVLCLFIILGLQAVSKKRGRQPEQNSFAGAHFLVLCVSLDGV